MNETEDKNQDQAQNDDQQGAADMPDDPEKLKELLGRSEAEKEQYLSGWQRAKADYLNYKKEEQQRLGDIAKYTSEDLMREMVTVLDNFDLGLQALEKAGPVEKGVYMIRSQIEDTLKKRGLERIPLKPGDQFDPAVAEAITEGESEQPPGTIAEEIEPGYRLYDKVLRPARVKLSKSKQ